jgi:hypothetical protein
LSPILLKVSFQRQSNGSRKLSGRSRHHREILDFVSWRYICFIIAIIFISVDCSFRYLQIRHGLFKLVLCRVNFGHSARIMDDTRTNWIQL